MNVKKKRDFKYIIIIGVLAATGWFLFQQKPDVRSTTVTHTDGEYRLWVEVNANRWTIENREQFAEKLSTVFCASSNVIFIPCFWCPCRL